MNAIPSNRTCYAAYMCEHAQLERRLEGKNLNTDQPCVLQHSHLGKVQANTFTDIAQQAIVIHDSIRPFVQLSFVIHDGY